MTGLNKYEGKARREARLKLKRRDKDLRGKPRGPFLQSSYKKFKLEDHIDEE